VRLGEDLYAELDRRLGPVDAALRHRYPGEPRTRQPVHTVYVPADRYRAGTALSYAEQALAALDTHGPLRTVLGIDVDIEERVEAKLRREPVEDLRVDFEDGYGVWPDAEEDAAARAAAAALPAEGLLCCGLRIKSLEPATRRRGVRTLDVFLDAFLDAAGALPDGFVVTLPKVSAPEQVSALVTVCERLEQVYGLAAGRLRFELQIEVPQAIVAADGTAAVVRMIQAAEGRCTGLHYGTYDYSAACGVAAAYQAMDHPAADHAKAVMQVAAAGTGVRLSDGSTNVLPVGDRAAVHAAWRLHAGLVRRSLRRAYYQGWDLHPAQLPTRYAATYAFYRESWATSASRLAAYLSRVDSGLLDEPATARALAGFLLRGLDCGALDEAEVLAVAGCARADLERLR
jgi:citrate lyase beta subunit